jgi:hypothetical protein
MLGEGNHQDCGEDSGGKQGRLSEDVEAHVPKDLEIEYALVPDDLVAFAQYHADHPPTPIRTGRRQTVLVALLGGVACVVTLMNDRVADKASALAIILIWIGTLLLLPWYYPRKWLIRKAVLRKLKQDKDDLILGSRRLVLTSQGIKSADPVSAAFFDWKGVEKLAMTDHHLFIYLTPVVAHAIPKRVFADEEAFLEFLETARRYRQEAKEGTMPAARPLETAIKV